MYKDTKCVGIIFGGASGEHDISIKSAITIINALREGINKRRYKTIPIYIDLDGRWWTSETAKAALSKGSALESKDLSSPLTQKGFLGFAEEHKNIDVWFPMLHGPNGEDGSIQGLLQLTNKPFVGSGVLGSALGLDKIAMKAAFKAANLPQVRYISAESNEIEQSNLVNSLIERIEKKLDYPYFIKPANLGSSVGISKAKNREELILGLKIAGNFDQRIIIEEGLNVRELECAVLGHKEIKISEVGEVNLNSEWYDYDAKYNQGSSKSTIPADIKDEVRYKVQDLTLKACKAICAYGLGRVDFFYNENDGTILINEINTLPGFTNQSMYPNLWRASGINLPELVSHLIDSATN